VLLTIILKNRLAKTSEKLVTPNKKMPFFIVRNGLVLQLKT
jgi:hypothetical protein